MAADDLRSDGAHAPCCIGSSRHDSPSTVSRDACLGQYVSSRSDSNGGAPSAVPAPARLSSGWLRSLREILENNVIPVWSATVHVDETIHDASPSPSSKARRKRPLSPPASRPTQVPITYRQPTGQPTAASAYCQPTAASAYCQPTGQPTGHGQPTAASAYCQPTAASAYCQPTAASAAASNSAESSTRWHPGMPKKLLHLFSGPGCRSDGMRALARELLRVDTVEIDTLIDEHDCDLLDDAVFDDLMRRVRAGEFFAAVIGTPCSTFSVARIPKHGVPDGGPPQLRHIDHADGMPGLSAADRRIIEDSDLLVERSVAVARLIRSQGGSFVIENPVTRSDKSSHLFRSVWRSHMSLWMHKLMRQLRDERWTREVSFPQCALGGTFQKWTTLLYTECLHSVLSKLGDFGCNHSTHQDVAVGIGEDGKWRSASSAAYPMAMNAILLEAFRAARAASRLYIGSAKPHAVSSSDATGAQPAPKAAPSRSSLRRLEPEVESVLRDEQMPIANAAPETLWADAPARAANPPGPLRTDEVFPSVMLSRLHSFRVAIGACFEAAGRGRWKWARDHRPPPLHATEDECLLPAARGWVWAYNDSDMRWHAVQPSSWPDDPPPGELDTAVIVQYAREHDYSDMEIISLIAHGYPGPELERCAVLGPPHVGTLKSPEAFLKSAKKDQEKGWVRHGYRLPPVWPMRADPMNIVFRNDKPRMTIDKTMQLVDGVDSYNSRIDLESQPAIDYVSVSMLGRAAAILMTAGVSVSIWGFDLEAYFRKTGKQRAHVWMSGFVHGDGYGADERVQFGQREAPVLCGRQSCFLIWAVRRELARLDLAYPSRVAAILDWLQHRSGRSQDDDPRWLWATLSFVLMYVDDVGGVSINDELFDSSGREIWVLRDGLSVRQTRGFLHFEAAIGVILYFGHSDSIDKRDYPGLDSVFLGVTIDLKLLTLSLSAAKALDYRSIILSILESIPLPNGTISVQPSVLSSLTHKLLHAASVAPLGRQHLFHIMRSARGEGAPPLSGGVRVLSHAALRELRWWEQVLSQEAVREGVPLASRTIFPIPSDTGVLVAYSDASREIGSAASGYGAWAVVDGVVYYVEGRWTDAEVKRLDINVLELLAMNIGSFAFLRVAAERGVVVTHLVEFTDNTAAEHSVERGKPKSPRLGELVRQRYVALQASNIFASPERVASVDNDVADGLSRGGSMLADALRTLAAAGYPVVRLEPSSEWRDSKYILSLSGKPLQL
jgi:hypothetical protein